LLASCFVITHLPSESISATGNPRSTNSGRYSLKPEKFAPTA
jgi:hypothetical protein